MHLLEATAAASNLQPVRAAQKMSILASQHTIATRFHVCSVRKHSSITFYLFFHLFCVLCVVACFLFVTRIPWKAAAAAEKARLNALVTTISNRLLDKPRAAVCVGAADRNVKSCCGKYLG